MTNISRRGEPSRSAAHDGLRSLARIIAKRFHEEVAPHAPGDMGLSHPEEILEDKLAALSLQSCASLAGSQEVADGSVSVH